ncbi:MAG: hypothetical protein DI589_06730 [Shinella sp.]|nr:MAG: hypothetical protein DI589_06730 [Shinella sp.]
MNKRERAELINQIAQWEWKQGGSSSEAAAVTDCIASLCQIFELSDDDLLFDRVWEMGRAVCLRNGEEMSEEWFDALNDLVDEYGLKEAINLLEEDGWGGFHDRVSAMVAA